MGEEVSVLRWDREKGREVGGRGAKKPSSAKQGRVEVGYDVFDGSEECLATTGGGREEEVGRCEVYGAGNDLDPTGEATFEAGEVDETPPEAIELPLPLGQARSPKGSSEEDTRAGLQVWRIDVHW